MQLSEDFCAFNFELTDSRVAYFNKITPALHDSDVMRYTNRHFTYLLYLLDVTAT